MDNMARNGYGHGFKYNTIEFIYSKQKERLITPIAITTVLLIIFGLRRKKYRIPNLCVCF